MPFLVPISLGGGIFLAIIILMIGYVNADSKRRGMNSLLWTLLVIFIPKALGFLAYFLLRKPLLMPCPNCRTSVGSDFRYCPKCGYALTPTCVTAAVPSAAITCAARIAGSRWQRRQPLRFTTEARRARRKLLLPQRTRSTLKKRRERRRQKRKNNKEEPSVFSVTSVVKKNSFILSASVSLW